MAVIDNAVAATAAEAKTAKPADVDGDYQDTQHDAPPDGYRWRKYGRKVISQSGLGTSKTSHWSYEYVLTPRSTPLLPLYRSPL